jgi:hypothetical protein
MIRPAVIVSMQFFDLNPATSKTPQNEGTEVKTDFFDEHEQQIGTAKTNNALTKRTTDYFDMRNNLIGRCESEWKGLFIR